MENHDTTPDTPVTPARPLAFWLRAADVSIARELRAAIAAEGIGRRDARLLTLLGADTLPPEVAERLRRHGGKKLRGLIERGWVAENDDTWALTDEGRAAAARLDEATERIRARISNAVSDDDLATTRASLEALVREFGAERAGRMPRGFAHRGFGPGRHGFGPGRGFHPGFGPGRTASPRGGCGEHHDHGPRAEHAYERGFDAGYARGREAGVA